MEVFYMICAGICTVSLTVGVVYLVQTLVEVKQTAQQARKTAQAVEKLALDLDQNVKNLEGVTQKVAEFSDGLASGWVRAAQMAAGFVTSLRDRWTESREERESEREQEATEER
jgi:uncharacterized protein YoxC